MGHRHSPSDRSRKPLGAARLDELALAYVARFATSRAKLVRYLDRKIRESQWTDEADPAEACAAIADRMARLGFLDDRQYAAMRGQAMMRRGLGARRVRAQLYADGIGESDSAPVLEAAEAGAAAAAIGFARRRRFGPFAAEPASDPARRERQVAAFARAGHAPHLARRILAVAPGDDAALDAIAALD